MILNYLKISRHEAVATVEIDRPSKHNALTSEVFSEISSVFTDLERDDNVRVIILRGGGVEAFSAGADITRFEEEYSSPDRAHASNMLVKRAEESVLRCTKPTIALVHGYCIGAGAGLALACDLRVASETAQFAVTPAKVGLVYGFEATKRIVQTVGSGRASLLLYSGRMLSAETAYEWGIFDVLARSSDVQREAEELAREISCKAPYTVTAAKSFISKINDGQTFEDSWAEQVQLRSFETDNFREGVRAFQERRIPNFAALSEADRAVIAISNESTPQPR